MCFFSSAVFFMFSPPLLHLLTAFSFFGWTVALRNKTFLNILSLWWTRNGKKALGHEWWKMNGMHAPSSTPLHIITTDPDNTAAHNYTIKASAAISAVFYLSPSYQKWHVQRWLAARGVNGSSWHSGRSWHPETAANQASIQTRFRWSQNKYTVRAPDRLQLQRGKLIWSKLAAPWSKLTGWITHKYKAEVTGVWSLCRQPTLKVYDRISTFSFFIPPLRIKWRSKFCALLVACVRVSITGVTQKLKGEGQGAHMVKGSGEVAQGGLDRLPLLLGRPASPRGLPDLINHFLLSMRSLRLWVWTPPSFRLPQVEWRDKDHPPPPIPSRLSCLSCGPPCSHVAAEVMVGGHRGIQRSPPRQKWQTTRLCSAAACVLLNHKGDVMQFNAPVLQICTSCSSIVLSRVNTQVTGSMCGYG